MKNIFEKKAIVILLIVALFLGMFQPMKTVIVFVGWRKIYIKNFFLKIIKPRT